MAELKTMKVIIQIDFVTSDGEQVCAHAKKVQELIRCGECKHWNPNTQLCATFSRMGLAHRMPPNGFCSNAERRSDE